MEVTGWPWKKISLCFQEVFSLIANRKICPARETDTLHTVASFLWCSSLAWVPPGQHQPVPGPMAPVEPEAWDFRRARLGLGKCWPKPGVSRRLSDISFSFARVVPTLLPGWLYTETPFPPGLESIPSQDRCRYLCIGDCFSSKKSFDPHK